MAKINDTVTYPNTTPALTDHVIGTDVSNTSNSADGEVVTFLLSDILALAEGKVLISTTTVSGATEFIFTDFDSTRFGSYEIELKGITMSTTTVNLRIETSSDGGSTWDTGANNYYWSNGTQSIYIEVINDTLNGVTSTFPVNGKIFLHGPHLTTYTPVNWDLSYKTEDGATDLLVVNRDVAYRQSLADVDGIRIYMSSGNFSGEISVYGNRK